MFNTNLVQCVDSEQNVLLTYADPNAPCPCMICCLPDGPPHKQLRKRIAYLTLAEQSPYMKSSEIEQKSFDRVLDNQVVVFVNLARRASFVFLYIGL